MSQTTTRPKAAPAYDEGNPFGSTGNFGGLATTGQDGSYPAGMPVGKELDRAQSLIATAARVAIKRNVPAIIQECRDIAAQKGDAVFYRWEVKTKSGGKEIIEGCSIVGAMLAASTYGNCKVGAQIASETATHWVFQAVFIDAEKGFTIERTFQQRKGQNIGGKMDADRGMDIVYQIGQSKAIRNVVVAALGHITDEIVDAAKQGLIQRISKAPDKAKAWLVGQFQMLDWPLAHVERVVTRKVADWTVPDMAKLMSQLSSVKDGFSNAADLWPSDAQQAQDQVDSEADAESLRKDAEALKGAGKQQKPEKTEAERVAEAQAERQKAADDMAAAKAQAEADAAKKAEGEKIVERDKAALAAQQKPRATKPKPAPEPEPEPEREPETQREPEPEDDGPGVTFE